MDSPFLRPVSAYDRDPLRLVIWALITVALFLAAVFGMMLLFGLLGADDLLVRISQNASLPEGPRRLQAEALFVLMAAIAIAGLFLPALVAAKSAFRRPAWTFVAPARPFDLRLLLLGFALFGAMAAAAILLQAALSGEGSTSPLLNPDYLAHTRLIYVLAAVPALLLAAAVEEIVFRGVLLQLTAAFTRSLPVLLVINGLVFSAMHLDPSPAAFVARAVSGAVWVWTVLRLSGIEFAVGAHLAHNLAIAFLVEPFSAAAVTGRDTSWQSLATDVALNLALIPALLLVLRSPRVREWIGEAWPKGAAAGPPVRRP
jgi:hypothetical protein